MKIAMVAFSMLFAAAPSFSQGLVNFLNGPSTLVSVGGPGQSTLIAGPQGSYYFGLLTAPLGTIDPAEFAFTGVYATNRSDALGRLYGGSGVEVTGWMPGDTKSFLVAGWSASLGHDWNAEWQKNVFGGIGYFGLSAIGSGYPGGLGGFPAFGIFGGITGIQTGSISCLFQNPRPRVWESRAERCCWLAFTVASGSNRSDAIFCGDQGDIFIVEAAISS